MRRFLLVCLLLPVAALVGTPQCAWAQKPQEVSIETADKLELKGTFFAGGNKAPVVLLLHEIGGDTSKGGWKDLAKKLQEEGYAVLMFDFRAHGDSTNVVDPKIFWSNGLNTRAFKPNKDNKIAQADLIKNQKTYLPMLLNDIAAAKYYLDQRNDAGDCNTSNTILIASKEAAGLASLWIAKEMQRIRMVPNPFNPLLFRPDPKKTIEGDDLRAAIWLTIPEKLISGESMSTVLKSPFVRDKVPMAFFYGEEDPAGKAAANALYNAMKTGANAKNFEATRLRKKDTKSAGSELLGKKGLDTEDEIVAYIKNVMEKKAEKAWVKRDAEKLPLVLLR